MVGLGFNLPARSEDLALLDGLLRTLPDYLEVAPESTWREDGRGELFPNAFADAFERIAEETGKPLVAHGVGLSLGDPSPDRRRQARWLRAIARDHRRRPFLWYTDHLGATTAGGEELTLPVALPQTEASAHAVRSTLSLLRRVVPDVGFENTVFYYHLGDPAAEPAFLRRCLTAPGSHLLLDLHNLHTTAWNTGIEAERWLNDVPLERVIEIHVSGGSASAPEWLPCSRTLHLDSHDSAVPEAVWKLLDLALPRCPNLRGLTLERMEGTVQAPDVALLTQELKRARRALNGQRVG